MKIFKVMLALSIFITSGSTLCGEVWKQITENIEFQYEALDYKGDDSKFEITLKNPQLLIDTPCFLGGIDHLGTIQLWVDVTSNSAKAEIIGTSHLICCIDDPEGQTQPLKFTIDGKRTAAIEVDFSKIKNQIVRMKNGIFSEDDFLTILENVKKGALDGTNGKLIFDHAMNDILLETAKINYAHTSGNTPEEFTLDLKIISNNQKKLFMMPQQRTTNVAGKISLGNMIFKSNLDISTNSEFDTTTAKMSMTVGAPFSIKFTMHGQIDLASDWVNKMVILAKKNPPRNSGYDTKIAKSIYNWIISPKSFPFLNQIPLRSIYDLNGSVEYSSAPDFGPEKGELNFSLVGNQLNGIKISYIGVEKGNIGTINTVLAGGRPFFNRLTNMYNAFGTSIISFVPKGNMAFKPISNELRDHLFQFLVSHAKYPQTLDKDLEFILKYGNEGITIGGKPLMDFAKEIVSLFYQEPVKTLPGAVYNQEIEDQVAGVR